MTRKGWIIGGLAVAVVGTVGVAIALNKDESKKGPKESKDGAGKPPEGRADADGVFRLDGTGLKQVACGARNAKSRADLARVLRGVQEAVRISGAERVDARNTGIVQAEMSAEEFDTEISEGIAKVEGISGFFWPVSHSLILGKLSGLPVCTAPAQAWEAAAAGTLQQALTVEASPEPLWGVARALKESR